MALVVLTAARLALRWAARSRERRAALLATSDAVEAALIAAALLFLVVDPFVLQAYNIPSASMRPTLAPHDHVVVDRLSYRLGRPARQEIAVCLAPPQALGPGEPAPRRDIVKRIVGLAGDVVEVREGHVLVNGRPLARPAGASAPVRDFEALLVPPGMVFVMGDNPAHSLDSRAWGALGADRLVGRVVAIIWPPGRAGAVR
ncbi:MAG: signal peptidase I [Chthonomonadales bacterium]|nr:signal peptidase I [Chthonomonadales bacterium]